MPPSRQRGLPPGIHQQGNKSTRQLLHSLCACLRDHEVMSSPPATLAAIPAGALTYAPRLSCAWGQVLSYENLAHKDDFSNAVLEHMELVYVFRDYGAELLAPFLQSHVFGKGRSDAEGGETRQELDLVITNYRLPHIDALFEQLFGPDDIRPPVIYSTHGCARGSFVQEVIDLPKEMEYLEEARSAGKPVFDLCTMSEHARAHGYDVQARKEGREADPHLCIPGPHLDMMELMFQMIGNLLGPAKPSSAA